MSKVFDITYNALDRVNTQINGEFWETIPRRWDVALAAEAGELLGQIGEWVWWKKVETDVEQVKLEVVDIVHFFYGLMARQGDLKNVRRLFGHEIDTAKFSGKFNPDWLTAAVLGLMKNITVERSYLHLTYQLKDIIEFAGFASQGEFIKLFLSKAALNIFRNQNGYLEGTYDKHFTLMVTKEFEEDNVHLMRFLSHFDDEFFLQENFDLDDDILIPFGLIYEKRLKINP